MFVAFPLLIISSSCFPSRLTFRLLLDLKYIGIVVGLRLAMV